VKPSERQLITISGLADIPSQNATLAGMQPVHVHIRNVQIFKKKVKFQTEK
jgi:hypothetical protein